MIRDWIEKAALRADAVYLEDARGPRRLTYRELRERAAAWAALLDREGAAPGARVVIRLPDPLDYAEALVSVVAAGRIAVPVDPGAPDADIARILKVAKPRVTLTRPAPSATVGPPVTAIPGATSGGGIFLCTSGTTGTPKGIQLTGAQLAHVAGCVVAQHRLTAADRGYCSLPLFHINAEVVGLLATLAAQARLALDRRFSRTGFWEIIAEREITWINAVPAIITLLADDPPADRPAAVRFIRSASAPLPVPVLRRFERVVGIPVIETYGMTESASMITSNPLDGPRKPGSAGKPAGPQVRVRADGADCPPMVTGRVQIRGPGVIAGYAEGGRPGAFDSHGWLDTGDLGYLDDDGYLFLAGRSDDVINRGGEKIYPREIEEILQAQPGVLTAVVVGVPDSVLGARPVAYVRPASTAHATLAEELRAACQANLPKYKQPSAFHLIQEMPLGPTGKVQRHRLTEFAATSP